MSRRLLGIAALLLTACGGPKVPLEVVGKSVPIKVSFGKGLPPVSVQPVPGGYILVPQPVPPEPLGPIRFPHPSPPKPPACPKASPLSFPEKAATTEILNPPKGAKYLFRTVGGERTIGPIKQTLPFIEERQVGNIETSVDPATGQTTIRYVVTATSTAEVVVSGFVADSRQLALTGIARFANGAWTSFAPPAPLQILPIPPRQALLLGNHLDTWQSAATDPLSQTTVSVDGKVISPARIDACGNILDSWLAELKVRWISPSEDTTATWRINVATQYGGLIISETITREGTLNGQPFKEKRTTHITQVPQS